MRTVTEIRTERSDWSFLWQNITFELAYMDKF